MPKRLKTENISKIEDEELKKSLWEERDKKIREIVKRYKVKTFWYGGPLYSRVGGPGSIPYSYGWFYYESVKQFVQNLRGHLFTYERFGGDIPYKMKYSHDHMEVFIPSIGKS